MYIVCAKHQPGARYAEAFEGALSDVGLCKSDILCGLSDHEGQGVLQRQPEMRARFV